MSKHKIQSFHSLMDEMRNVAKGKRAAPKDAARASFNSAEALVRLLTSENRELLAVIRDQSPESLKRLSELTGRAQPNLTRTIGKLEAAGLVKSRIRGNKKVLTVPAKKIVVEIDPFSDKDTLRIAS